MSSTNTDPKPTENETNTASDLNVDKDTPATSTAALTAGSASLSAPVDDTPARRPGSPQAPIENPFADVHDNDDVLVHPAAPISATATDNATTAAAATHPTSNAPGSTLPTAFTEPTQAPTTPASEREAKLTILTEAFPTVEKEVCEFVLESHRGDVEASINALLEISDPEFQPEPQQVAPPTAAVAPRPNTPPALPQRHDPDTLAQGVANLDVGQNHPRTEIDPIFLASTSTSEQQLRADEDFARTLAAMDEYRARDRQNLRNQQAQQQQQQQQQQQGEEGPSFTQELKELMDEELPKIKERFNVAADTTKKKVTGWYNQFKQSRAEATARNQATRVNQGRSSNDYDNQDGRWSNEAREPIQFGSRVEDDEPLARNRTNLPSSGTNPPLPTRPYNVDSTDTTRTEPASNTPTSRRTTVEDGTHLGTQP